MPRLTLLDAAETGSQAENLEKPLRRFIMVGNPGQDERDSGMIPNGVPG